ncbi:MAG: hypothetical protein HZB85_01380 [Deltaproteobacteria bacterium]|nr:hypothetical protein [Deltaproteobacteria bacterium]
MDTPLHGQEEKPDRHIDGPIIVYQMGKVGSRSVFETLEKLNLGIPVYHCHVLHDLDKIAEQLKKQFDNPFDSLAVVRQGKDLRKLIDEAPAKPWHVVSLVRDPIAQTISRFFQSIEEVIPNAGRRFKDGALNVEDLFSAFEKKWILNDPALIWFDNQFKPVFDIDVYERPFPCAKGYDIFRKGRFSLLLFRLEDLDGCAPQAFEEFFGLADFKLMKANEAANKWYQGLYKEFISKIDLSKDYLDKVYGSKFSRHFYTKLEINAFRAKWTRKPAVGASSAGVNKAADLKSGGLERKDSEIAGLRKMIDAKEREIAALRNSLSWKVTAPLRAVGGIFMK